MAKKEAGGRSAAQNDFLEPLAPENVSATNVGTNRPYNNGALTVSWTINTLSPAAVSYTVTDPTYGTLKSDVLPTPVSGTYTVTVEGLTSSASHTVSVYLTNGSGDSDSGSGGSTDGEAGGEITPTESATPTPSPTDSSTANPGDDGDAQAGGEDSGGASSTGSLLDGALWLLLLLLVIWFVIRRYLANRRDSGKP